MNNDLFLSYSTGPLRLTLPEAQAKWQRAIDEGVNIEYNKSNQLTVAVEMPKVIVQIQRFKEFRRSHESEDIDLKTIQDILSKFAKQFGDQLGADVTQALNLPALACGGASVPMDSDRQSKHGLKESQLIIKHRLAVARKQDSENCDDEDDDGSSLTDCRHWASQEIARVQRVHKQKTGKVASLRSNVNNLGSAHADVKVQKGVELLAEKDGNIDNLAAMKIESTTWSTLDFVPRFNICVELVDEAVVLTL